MKHLKLMAMILGVMFAPSLASAACSSPVGSGDEGEYYYNSTTKAAYYCNGSSWVAMGTAGAWQDKPTIGAGGGSVVTLCNVEVGEPCGGGYYAGDGNLVITPPSVNISGTIYVACTDGSNSGTCNTPVCSGSVCKSQEEFAADANIQKEFGKTPSSWGAYQGSFRYGYEQGNRADISTFWANSATRTCKDLVYGGYSDWYLPNAFEGKVIQRQWYKHGSFQSNTHYFTTTPHLWNGNVITAFQTGLDMDEEYGIGGSEIDTTSGSNRWAFHRCVRRN